MEKKLLNKKNWKSSLIVYIFIKRNKLDFLMYNTDGIEQEEMEFLFSFYCLKKFVRLVLFTCIAMNCSEVGSIRLYHVYGLQRLCD